MRAPRRLTLAISVLVPAAALAGLALLRRREPPRSPFPRVALDRPGHDFAVARQLDVLRTTFTVRNEGSLPLHASVRTECGCMRAAFSGPGADGPAATIAGGGSAVVETTFDTGRYLGPVSKHVLVLSDDPETPQAAFTVSLDVSGGVLLAPDVFYFENTLVGTKPTSTIEVKWKDGAGRPFHVTSVEGRDMSPTGAQPVFEATPFDAPPWHGYHVRLDFATPPPVGMVTGKALIHTDDPATPVTTATIGGLVAGKVMFSEPAVALGMLAAGTGAKRTIQLRGFDPTLDLGRVVATSRKGAVRVHIARNAAPHLKYVWFLELEVPPEAPAGPLEDVIDVTTDVEGYTKLELPVTATVPRR